MLAGDLAPGGRRREVARRIGAKLDHGAAVAVAPVRRGIAAQQRDASRQADGGRRQRGGRAWRRGEGAAPATRWRRAQGVTRRGSGDRTLDLASATAPRQATASATGSARRGRDRYGRVRPARARRRLGRGLADGSILVEREADRLAGIARGRLDADERATWSDAGRAWPAPSIWMRGVDLVGRDVLAATMRACGPIAGKA
jgi:hypothetical protein